MYTVLCTFLTKGVLSMFKKLALVAMLSGLSFTAYANHNPAHTQEDAVKSSWAKNHPTMKIGKVKATAISGVFKMDTEVFIDPTGRFMMVGGKIFDTLSVAGGTQPSAQPQARPEPPKNVDVKLLNTANAIKTVKGTGERVLYVFSDPDCPFCKRLENTLESINNVTVYTFPYPLEALHPNAKAVSVSVWCNANPSQAWKDYMLKGVKPEDKVCDNPIAKNIELAQKLNINGTPAIIGPTGIVLPGAYPAEAIEEMLKNSVKK